MNKSAFPNKQQGFNLTELLIVIVIIGVLSAIALPAYQDYSRTSKRSDAHQALNQMAQLQERHFTDNNAYATAAGPVGAGKLGYASATPNSTGGYWQLSVVAAQPAGTYRLQAVPTGGHADAECATITLDSTGLRASTPSGNDCWAGK